MQSKNKNVLLGIQQAIQNSKRVDKKLTNKYNEYVQFVFFNCILV